MSLYVTFTALWLVFLILAAVTALGLVFFLRKLTIEWAHSEGGFKFKKHWWRFALPSAVAIFFTSFQNVDMNIFVHVIYILIMGLLVPFAVTFYFLRASLENKRERMAVTMALLLLLNATFFSTHWYFHYRENHSNGYEDNGGVNPHLSARNWVMIPLWVVTIFSCIGSVVMWRRENRKENETLLPTNEQPTLA